MLLVDDHVELLKSVSRMLAPDFDIVGVATGGEQALQAARRLDPDLVVLDIAMPGLNGFQTMRAFSEARLRAPVVFLSTYDTDGYIDEAFECGGRGYVVKTRIAPDLVSALDHVLLGRRFAPSLTSLLSSGVGGGHAMHVHGGEDALIDGLADFFALALEGGDATCIIATKPFREQLGVQLRARGWNVGGSPGYPRYLEVDAVEALDRLMTDGLPDVARLAEIVAEMDQYRRAVAEGPESRLTLFGNMAALLSMQGNTTGAVELETNWSALTEGLPFFTVCGYSAECVHDERHPDLFPHISDRHSAVSHAPDL